MQVRIGKPLSICIELTMKGETFDAHGKDIELCIYEDGKEVYCTSDCSCDNKGEVCFTVSKEDIKKIGKGEYESELTIGDITKSLPNLIIK